MKRFFIYLLLSILVMSISYSFARRNHKVTLLSKKAPLSLYDHKEFIDFFEKASNDPLVFENFKRNSTYNLLHEYYSYEEGKQFLSFASSQNFEFKKDLERLRENDHLGNPRIYYYQEIGFFSPSTLHYIQIASDLKREFGSLDGFRVAQIGAGYGGLCKVVSQLFPIESYTIFDLKQTLVLAQTYLTKLKVPKVSYRNIQGQFLEDSEYDLIISDYGFGEFNQMIQKKLLKMMKRAKRGYLRCTFYPKHFGIKTLNKQQILDAFSSSDREVRILKEEPSLGKDNFILVWQKKSDSV